MGEGEEEPEIPISETNSKTDFQVQAQQSNNNNNTEIEIFTPNIEFEKPQTNKIQQEETDFYKTTGIQPSECFVPNYGNNLPNNKF